MPSILNGLFSGRAGLASHGLAMAVIGDNISNVSTVGFKQNRAEFEDVVAGGQTSGKVVGSGSSISGVTQIFDQGTLEFTGRSLDLAVDGNGLFAVAKGSQRFYTRAGNFKVDSAGYIVNQNDMAVLGFPENGTGSLQPLNVNTISQSSVATTEVTISGNVDANASTISSSSIPTVSDAGATSGFTTTTYAQLNAVAEFSTVVEVFDSLGDSHTITFYFFHTGSNQYTVRGYVNSEDVDPSSAGTDSGLPRLIVDSSSSGDITMTFAGTGSRNNTPSTGSYDLTAVIPWNNGSNSSTINLLFDPFTQYAASSNILSISQDGEGIGTVTDLSIDKDGTISALLDNGQTATIGKIGLVTFANVEGLTRIGKQLYQQSTASGEPIIGKPQTGTFGSIEAGSLELSTVDIANEFVKLITLQRGFQASSRIIQSINQLLNEIIQLA